MVFLVVFGFLAVRYSKGTVNGMEFEGAVRGVILSNPLMGDPEAVERVTAAAKKTGVALDPGSIRVERGGQTMVSAGGISSIHVEYVLPIDMGLWTSHKAVTAEVLP